MKPDTSRAEDRRAAGLQLIAAVSFDGARGGIAAAILQRKCYRPRPDRFAIERHRAAYPIPGRAQLL